jgi:hypothetical protein
VERGSRKRSSRAGSEKMERVRDRLVKNGRTLFDRPKPTVGCSGNGRRIYGIYLKHKNSCNCTEIFPL